MALRIAAVSVSQNEATYSVHEQQPKLYAMPRTCAVENNMNVYRHSSKPCRCFQLLGKFRSSHL